MKGMKDRGGRGDGGIGDFFLGLGPRPSRLVQSEVFHWYQHNGLKRMA